MGTATTPPPFDLLEEETDEDAERLDAEALVEAEAKGWISWEVVKPWLQSWGKPDELPPPQVGD